MEGIDRPAPRPTVVLVACPQFDKEQHIDCFERDRFHREEVAGQDLVFEMTPRKLRQVLLARSETGGIRFRFNTFRTDVALTSYPSLSHPETCRSPSARSPWQGEGSIAPTQRRLGACPAFFLR